MFSIQFEQYDFSFKKNNGQTFIKDIIRKKWVVFTPEEWVRQNMVHYLINTKNYPISSIVVEKEIKLFEKNKRFDIVVYDNDFLPHIIIECKNQGIALTGNVVQQLLSYQTKLQCKFLYITNGSETLGWATLPDLHKVSEIPAYIVK